MSDRQQIRVKQVYAFRISSQPLRYVGRLTNGSASGDLQQRRWYYTKVKGNRHLFTKNVLIPRDRY